MLQVAVGVPLATVEGNKMISSFSEQIPHITPLVLHAHLGNESTILLVEDEAFLRNVASEVLQAAGYEVLVAENAEDAILLFRGYRRPVQILLTDVVLPKKSGLAMANELKGLSPELKVVFISGYTRTSAPERTAGTADASYLAKPFSAADLLETIGIVENGAEARSEA